MNKGAILKFIQAGESLTLEFKSDRGPLPADEMVEAVVILANNHGGHRFVGVEDYGEIIGLHKRHLSIIRSLAGCNGVVSSE